MIHEPMMEYLRETLGSGKPPSPGEYSLRKVSSDKIEEKKNKGSILLVEDDQDVRESVFEALAEEGYSVIATRNGVEAIRVLTYKPELPDLILLDLMMPVMDGWEFQRRCENNPKWANIPIVIYSANTKTKPIKATVVLAKPCSLEQLVAAISAHVVKDEEE
jgi:CheY-like chemotaxis protein